MPSRTAPMRAGRSGCPARSCVSSPTGPATISTAPVPPRAAAGRGRHDREPDVHQLAVAVGGHRVARVEEDVEHAPVLGQRLGKERGDPPLAGRQGQPLEQPGPDAVVLVLVGHHEGHLGLFGAPPVVAGDARESPVHHGHQGQPVPVVEAGEPLDLDRREPGVGPEEPEAHRVRRQPQVEGAEGVGVGRADGPDLDEGPVVEELGALEVRRVARRQAGPRRRSRRGLLLEVPGVTHRRSLLGAHDSIVGPEPGGGQGRTSLLGAAVRPYAPRVTAASGEATRKLKLSSK